MIYLTLCLLSAVATGLVARARGTSWLAWGLIGGVLPVLGLIGVLAYRREDEELRRACPSCGRVCKIYDAICTRCGAELEFPEVAIESVAEAERRGHRAA